MRQCQRFATERVLSNPRADAWNTAEQLFQKRLLFIFSSLIKRDRFTQKLCHQPLDLLGATSPPSPRPADTPSQFSSTIEGKHKITLELHEKEKYYFLVALRNSDNGEADNAARMLFKSLRDRELVINGEY
jgi:hypothetical protein